MMHQSTDKHVLRVLKKQLSNLNMANFAAEVQFRRKGGHNTELFLYVLYYSPNYTIVYLGLVCDPNYRMAGFLFIYLI